MTLGFTRQSRRVVCVTGLRLRLRVLVLLAWVVVFARMVCGAFVSVGSLVRDRRGFRTPPAGRRR